MASGNEKETSEFCPKINPVSPDTLQLSYDEKLKIVEDEVKSLYAFCLKKGFSKPELQDCASKLRGPPKAITRKVLEDSTVSFVYLSLLVAAIAFVYQSAFVYNIAVVHAKLGMIKFVLPHWDWSSLYKADCLIENVYLPEKNITYNKRTCEYCMKVVKLGENIIDRLNNTDHDEITKHYIENVQPVVVTDTTKDWHGKEKLTMDFIASLYQTDTYLSTSMGSCYYQTNVGFNETFYDFITAYVNKDLPENWHINWQNCDSKSTKILRKYYTRPYFLPGMAQASSDNTIIAAKGKQETVFDPFMNTGNSGHWITVVSGELKVTLTPYSQCMEKYKCQAAEVLLSPGETVFFLDEVWKPAYVVSSDDITIAIASSVIWDEMN